MKRLHNIEANHFNAIFYDIFVTASVLNSLSSWRFNEINEQLHPDSIEANQIVFTNTQTQNRYLMDMEAMFAGRHQPSDLSEESQFPVFLLL